MPNTRYYCATFYTEPNVNLFTGRYMISGKEICPKTQRVHWQCYLEYTNPVSFKFIKSEFQDTTVHLEKRQGTREQARDYCKKEGNYVEHGIWCTGQGFRTDLKSKIEQLSNGELSLNQLMREDPELYCRYRNGLKDVYANIQKERSREFRHVEVIVISGPTDSGKTRMARKEATFKIEGDELTWWDGYDDDKCIVIDEYDNHVKITRLLNLLDGYQLRLPIKGGFTYAAWTKVYITTNLHKEELHSQAKPEHIKALFRRITQWIDLW